MFKWVGHAYIEQLKMGMSSEEATQYMINRNPKTIEDKVEGPMFWFNLAEAQWNYGRLLPYVKENALKYLETDEHLSWWKLDGEKAYNKRVKVLDELKVKLLTPMPPEKKVSIYKLYKCEWKLGDVFAYKLNSEYSIEKGFYGKYIVFRKVGEDTSYPGHIVPVIHVYKWIGEELPPVNIVNSLSLLPQAYKPSYYKDLKNDPIEYRLTAIIESKRAVKKDTLFYLGNICELDNPKNQINEYIGNYGCIWKSLDKFAINAYTRWQDIDFNNL